MTPILVEIKEGHAIPGMAVWRDGKNAGIIVDVLPVVGEIEVKNMEATLTMTEKRTFAIVALDEEQSPILSPQAPLIKVVK